MKRLIYLLLAFVPLLSMGQSSDSQLTTQSNIIRNEANPAGNTKGRIADMFQSLINSKQSRLEQYTVNSTNTYTVSTTGTFVASYTTQLIVLKFTNANTGSGPFTLNVNGLGAKVIKKSVNLDLVAGDLKAGGVYIFAYDGTNFQMLGSIGAGGSFTLTDGNGTTASGSAVDLGGQLNGDVLITDNLAGGHTITIGGELDGDLLVPQITLTAGSSTQSLLELSDDLVLNTYGDVLFNANGPSTGKSIQLNSVDGGKLHVSDAVKLPGTSAGPAKLQLYEDTDNGINYTEFKTVASQSSNIIYTLPSAYPASSGQVLSGSTGGALSWVDQTGGGGSVIGGSGISVSGSTVNWNSAITEDINIPDGGGGGHIINIGADSGGNTNRVDELNLYGGAANLSRLNLSNDAVLSTDGTGIVQLVNPEGGTVSVNGSVTLEGIGISIQSDGAAMELISAADIIVTSQGPVSIGGTSANPGRIQLYEDTDLGSQYTEFKVGSQAGNISYTLPTAAPAVNGYVLAGTTGGVLSWVAQSGGGGGLVDGDYGDITVGGTGTTMTIDNGVVNDAKIATHTTTKISTTNKALLNSAIVYNDQVNTYSDGTIQTFNPSNTNPGLVVGSNSSRPSSPVEGALFFNTTTKDVEAYIDGVWSGLTRGEDITDATTARTITASDRNKTIIFTNSGSITITLNGTPVNGTAVCIWKEVGSGTITISASGSLKAVSNQMLTDNTGAWFIHEGGGVWRGMGALGSAASGTFVGLTDGPGVFTGKTLNYPRVNAGETALEYRTPAQVRADIGAGTGSGDALTTNPLSQFASTTSAQLRGVISDEVGTGVLYFVNGALGTPSSGVATNFTGTASGLTAGNVTTNANLTGPITSVGNATSIASQTGTGSTFAMSVSPALTGSPTVPNQSANTNSTIAANTAYADAKVADAINDGTTTIAPSQNALFDALALKSSVNLTINNQTTAYTLVLGDAGKDIEINNASPLALTVPLHASVAYVSGTLIKVTNYGAGLVTIGGSGITFRNSGPLTLTQYQTATLEYRTSDEWYVFNGTTLVTGNLTKVDDTNVLITIGNGSGAVLGSGTTVTMGWAGTLSAIRGGTQQGTVTAGDVLWGSATDTWARKNILATTQTSYWHLKAGSATASTSPIKLTSGPPNTTAEAGAVEYDGNFHMSKFGGVRWTPGGCLWDAIADVSNTSTTETDLNSYTLPISTLNVNGDKVSFSYSGSFTDATATCQLRLYFDGTSIGDTGALTVAATGAWYITGWIIRTAASTARVIVNVSVPGVAAKEFDFRTNLTSKVFTNTNILKITGTAAGATGGTGDIVLEMATGGFKGAAFN